MKRRALPRELADTRRFSKARLHFLFHKRATSNYIVRAVASACKWEKRARVRARVGIRRPLAGINQKGNLKKGLQPARCVTTPKGCRTANSQECRYLEEIASLARERERESERERSYFLTPLEIVQWISVRNLASPEKRI